jgi:hypothetical protein
MGILISIITYPISGEVEYNNLQSILARSTRDTLQEEIIKHIRTQGFYIPIIELDRERLLLTLHVSRVDERPIDHSDAYMLGVVIHTLVTLWVTVKERMEELLRKNRS